jgi:hypothetical protein
MMRRRCENGVPQISRKALKKVFTNRLQKTLDFGHQNQLDFSRQNQVSEDLLKSLVTSAIEINDTHLAQRTPQSGLLLLHLSSSSTTLVSQIAS